MGDFSSAGTSSRAHRADPNPGIITGSGPVVVASTIWGGPMGGHQSSGRRLLPTMHWTGSCMVPSPNVDTVPLVEHAALVRRSTTAYGPLEFETRTRISHSVALC